MTLVIYEDGHEWISDAPLPQDKDLLKTIEYWFTQYCKLCGAKYEIKPTELRSTPPTKNPDPCPKKI